MFGERPELCQLLLSVLGELQLHEPAFTQYVTKRHWTSTRTASSIRADSTRKVRLNKFVLTLAFSGTSGNSGRKSR
uniref:Uncharacterized protein n=1 Tax=Knipowitschia caucasica TaxID=637954 RepID=A0AAV2JRW2_KNICA